MAKYDLDALRWGPQRIERRVTQRHKPLEITEHETAEQAWAKMRDRVRNALQGEYPIERGKETTGTGAGTTGIKWCRVQEWDISPGTHTTNITDAQIT